MMLGEQTDDYTSGTQRPRADTYAQGWNDAIKLCSERVESAAKQVAAAGSGPLARMLRRMVEQFRGTDGGRGRPPRTGG